MKRIISFTAFPVLMFTIYAYSAAQVTVFTIPNCSKCVYMINYLKSSKIQYTEITSADPERGEKLWAALQSTGTYKGGTVYGPTVVINGKTYYSIQNLESFTASIPALLSGGNSSGNQTISNKDTDLQFIKNITDRHNYYRQSHGAQLLKWNKSIAEFAKSWADKIAAEDRMYHRQPNSYGENIYWKSGGDVNGSSPVDSWYSEIKSYNYQNPEFDMATGHFTQVVWAGTAEFGCASARSKNGGIYVVCNYNPPGNYQGMFSKNVLPLKSTGGNSSSDTSSNTNNITNNNGSIQSRTFSNGTKYTGQMLNGKMHGQGTITYKGGSVYTGMLKNGSYHGQGIMNYSNGDRYEGEWKNNLMHGFGKYYWVNGSWYSGYYEKGSFNGEGTLFISGTPGKTQTGRFKNGKFLGN